MPVDFQRGDKVRFVARIKQGQFEIVEGFITRLDFDACRVRPLGGGRSVWVDRRALIAGHVADIVVVEATDEQ